MKSLLKVILLIVLALSAPNPAAAGKLYICIDKNGDELITDERQGGMECHLKETYRDPSPEETAKQQLTDKESAVGESPVSQTGANEEQKDKTDSELCKRNCKVGQEKCDDECSRRRSQKPRCRTLCEYYYKQCVEKCTP